MGLTEELNKIKKIYGEKFMHLCRKLFPTILEQEGQLLGILTSLFGDNCKTLGEDIVERQLEDKFKDFIYNEFKKEDNTKKRNIYNDDRTPFEILSDAGYNLYECTSEEEIQAFSKYYAKGEKLCTFDGKRLDKRVVFFAVKKNVDAIRREDFKHPQREDAYGTSVLGIQFNKRGICTVSILNRYNHTIKDQNPDATFGNDLDEIPGACGLTESFRKLLQDRGLQLSLANIERLSIPGYTVAGDGKLYKYNMEIDGIYYCPGNIVIKDGEVIKLPNHQMLIDYFLLDVKAGTLCLYNNFRRDSFLDEFNYIEKIEIQKKPQSVNGERRITIRGKGQAEPIIIDIGKDNQIIGYINNSIGKIDDHFMFYSKGMKYFQADNLTRVGNYFQWKNEALEQIVAPKLKSVGNYFLSDNNSMRVIDLPSLLVGGHHFAMKI